MRPESRSGRFRPEAGAERKMESTVLAAEAGFISEIADTPDDVTPRLIFADWLEERGDPRGEFIRIQCELADPSEDIERRERLDERQEELRRQFEAEWTTDLKGKVLDWTFHRGMVEYVEVDAADLYRHSEYFRKHVPIRFLTIRGSTEQLHAIHDLELLPQLVGLCLDDTSITQSDAHALSQACLPKLQTLSLSRCGLTDERLQPILNIDAPNLVAVDLSLNRLRNRSASATSTRARLSSKDSRSQLPL